MAATTVAAAVLFALSWLIYRAAARRRDAPLGVAWFYRFYQSAIAAVAVPLVDAFWNGISQLAVGTAASVRRLYTGNGQTYLLYMLYYVAVIYVAAT